MVYSGLYSQKEKNNMRLPKSKINSFLFFKNKSIGTYYIHLVLVLFGFNSNILNTFIYNV